MGAYFCSCGTERGPADSLIAIMPTSSGTKRIEVFPGFLKIETLEGAATAPEPVQLRACRQCALVYAFVPPVDTEST